MRRLPPEGPRNKIAVVTPGELVVVKKNNELTVGAFIDSIRAKLGQRETIRPKVEQPRAERPAADPRFRGYDDTAGGFTDPRLHGYEGIASGFERGVERILRSRCDEEGKIDDFLSMLSLAKDVAILLCGLVRKYKAAKRAQRDAVSGAANNIYVQVLKNQQPDEDANRLLLVLKTIVLEKAQEIFDEATRNEFIRRLDNSIAIETWK